jgi:simple sugar transport system permease protein
MLAAPLALAAMGGLLSERSGVIDIGLEGKMLGAACVAALAGATTHSALAAALAGIGAGLILSLAQWLFTQKYRIDHVVSGMALNALALGATNFLNTKFLSTAGELPTFWKLHITSGTAGATFSIYALLAFVLPFGLHTYLRRTRGGIRLLAVGNSPEKSRLAGLEPLKIRLLALTATGILSGIAGLVIIDNAGRFVDNMTAGRGYIALAAVIIGGWRPVPAFVACLVFGALDALQIALQGVRILGVEPPPQLWQSMPYIIAVVTLAGLVKRGQAPYGIGRA